MKKYLIITMCLLLSGCNYSEGERYGQITKLSNKGFICKSWEGELATFAGKYKRIVQGTALMNTFQFSVTDKNVVNEIKEAAKNGNEIAIKYEEKFFVWPCSHDSEYVVIGINK